MAGGGGVQSTETSDLKKGIALRVQPNPAKTNVTISYAVHQLKNARLKIYDATGRLVKQYSHLTNYQSSIVWNCCDDNGTRLPNGIYFVRLESEQTDNIEKILILS